MSRFCWIITMLKDPCSPLTMKLIGLGRPLNEAERIAAVMVVWVVLLCALMGYTVTTPGIPEREEEDDSSGSCGILIIGTEPAGGCGILPVYAGTAGIGSRALLQR